MYVILCACIDVYIDEYDLPCLNPGIINSSEVRAFVWTLNRPKASFKRMLSGLRLKLRLPGSPEASGIAIRNIVRIPNQPPYLDGQLT